MNTNKFNEYKNTSGFYKANSNINKNKKLILGAITRYSWETVTPFFRPLIKANISNYDCVMFMRIILEDV